MSTNNSSFNYIVVGGGTAGVVIASRLAQHLPSCKVAIFEAGPNAVDNSVVTTPPVPTLASMMALAMEGVLVDYSTTAQTHCDDRKFFNFAGRLLSGSSGVNMGVWMRPSSTDLELIAQKAGNERFEFKNMLQYYKKIESYGDKKADPDFHGFDGPVHTVGARKYPLRDIVEKTAEAIGYSYNPDGTMGDPTGMTDFINAFRATSESTSTRQHSAKVYDLSKVEVFCDSSVARILFDGNKRATGVQLVSGEIISATKEIIVSCGTQRTPQLLMLSGVGPSDELQKHRIPTIIDSTEVGKNLTDHLVFTQFFKLKDPAKGFSHPFQGTAKPEYGQGWPVDFTIFGNISTSELTAALKDDISSFTEEQKERIIMLTKDRRCHYMLLPFYIPGHANPATFPNLDANNGKHISFVALNLLPVSRGTVTLASADPNDNPVVDPQFLSTPADKYILRRAVRENIRLTETEPLASQIECETPPTVDNVELPTLSSKSSDEEIDARIRMLVGTISHPMGTCALGTVLDDEFRVKGLGGNLRVCDASVFPDPLAAMPSQTVYALAELCADLIIRSD